MDIQRCNYKELNYYTDSNRTPQNSQQIVDQSENTLFNIFNQKTQSGTIDDFSGASIKSRRILKIQDSLIHKQKSCGSIFSSKEINVAFSPLDSQSYTSNINEDNYFDDIIDYLLKNHIKEWKPNTSGSKQFEVFQNIASNPSISNNLPVKYIELSHHIFKETKIKNKNFLFYRTLENINTIKSLKILSIRDCENLPKGDLSALVNSSIHTLELYSPNRLSKGSDFEFLSDALNIKSLKIVNNKNIVSMLALSKNISNSNRYKHLHFENMPKLRYIPTGYEKITIINCPKLTLESFFYTYQDYVTEINVDNYSLAEQIRSHLNFDFIEENQNLYLLKKKES